MNPFVSTQAGFFVATGAATGSSTSLAQRIAAAVCNQVMQDQQKVLDPSAWQAVIDQIPFQASMNLSTGNLTLSGNMAPAEMAQHCVPTGSPLAAALEKAIGQLEGNTSLLNVFSVSELSPSLLRLMFVSFVITPTFHGYPAVTVNSTVTNLSLPDQAMVQKLNDVFGKFEPPAGTDYFISVNNTVS
jgi:hypothetical protein